MKENTWLVQSDNGDTLVADDCYKPTKFCHRQCYLNMPDLRLGFRQVVYADQNQHVKSVTCGICGQEIRTQFYVNTGEEEHFL